MSFDVSPTCAIRRRVSGTADAGGAAPSPSRRWSALHASWQWSRSPMRPSTMSPPAATAASDCTCARAGSRARTSDSRSRLSGTTYSRPIRSSLANAMRSRSSPSQRNIIRARGTAKTSDTSTNFCGYRSRLMREPAGSRGDIGAHHHRPPRAPTRGAAGPRRLIHQALVMDDAPAGSSEPPMTRPLQVTLVDDSPIQANIARALLEKAGHTVVTYRSGREALRAIPGRPPDCVLMDVMMPEIDGYELCRQLHAMPALA